MGSVAIEYNAVHCYKHQWHVAHGNQAFIASTACALADTGRLLAGLPFNQRLPVLPPNLHGKPQCLYSTCKTPQAQEHQEPFSPCNYIFLSMQPYHEDIAACMYVSWQSLSYVT